MRVGKLSQLETIEERKDVKNKKIIKRRALLSALISQ